MPNWGQLLTDHEGLPPPRVPGYRVLELLGGHGQSEVYLAEDALGQRVALKRWKLPSPRAQRELAALERLDAPGIVRVIGGAEDQALGLPCLIMAFVDAPQLLAEGGRLEVAEACRILRQVAASLAAVHRAGLIHRDVKPANVLVSAAGEVTLVDFGIVKDDLAQHQTELTARGGAPIGTLPYMAPEQLGLLADPLDTRADIYALGATLYQCLTGALPFETDGAYEREHRQVWKDPPAGAQVAGVPPALQELVTRCLAYQPSARPPDAEAVARSLDALLAAVEGGGPRRQGWLAGAALIALALLALALWSGSARRAHSSPVDTAPQPSLAAVASQAAPLRELVLQPGPLLGCDTYASSSGLYPNDNFGVEASLRVGFRPPSAGQPGELRSFLRFDLGPLPADLSLEEAWLELRCLRSAYGPGPAQVELARVLPSGGGRTPWREGSGGIDQVLDGLAWSGAFRGPTPDSSSAAPDLSQPDAGPPLASASPRVGAWVRLDARAALQAWLAGESNFGLRVAPASEPGAGQWIFHSSDSLEQELRPRLIVRYRGPPPSALPCEPDLYPAARAEAAALLRGARERLRADDLRGALTGAQAAAARAPFWGEPFAARAALAKRLGWASASRLDMVSAFSALEPTRSLASYRLLAEGHLSQAGLAPRVQGLALLLVLACDPQEGPAAEATLAEILRDQPDLRAGLARPELREIVTRELEWLAQSQARGAADAPRLGALPLARGLLLLASGSEALAALELARAEGLGSADPALWAPAPPTPRAARLRVCFLAAAEGIARALPALREAQARWPQDPGLARLAASLGA